MDTNNMERNYLTDKIFLVQNKLYYEENNKIKDVKNYNWHHILKEYGWEKLHKQWIKKLNSYLEKTPKNSLYGCLDCGGEGDCLFHCISYALNMNLSEEYDSKILREKISNSLTEERYEELIEVYRIINDANEFEEDWDPQKMTMETFKKILIEGGNDFWGDFLTLSLIKEYLKINIIILNSNELTGEYYHYPLLYEYDNQMNTIILLYEDAYHFKLIGNFQNGEMITLFNHKVMPIEILKLINYLR
tara:strand:+ start:343 stop:1083 length:741 start_codon:yes stop_codon:yes gene_type:complete